MVAVNRFPAYADGSEIMKSLIAILLLAVTALAQTPQNIRSTAEQAYLFAYPLVLMEHTRLRTPAMNRINNSLEFPGAAFRNVVRPNADTLYSSAWIDLGKEPLILKVPDTQDRYYLMQFMDAWTETFAIPGKRTTGTKEGYFAIVGPTFKGKLPERTQRLDSATNMVWLIGRTQTNGPSDYPNVHAIQRGFQLMPLSLYPDGPRAQVPAPRPPVAQAKQLNTPPVEVQNLTTKEFFDLFVRLLVQNPPHKEDGPMLEQLTALGIVAGKAFRPEALGDGAKAFEEGVSAARARLAEAGNRTGRAKKNGWTGFGSKVGRYGADYAARAMVARIGLGANPPEDAVYLNCNEDIKGLAIDGTGRYRIRFAKSQLPPVKAFWSLTAYNEDGYFAANTINRFAIGDRDPLKFNADGSLDIYVQRSAPSAGKESNWLPVPDGKFNLSLRLYWPTAEVLNGRWVPPGLERISE